MNNEVKREAMMQMLLAASEDIDEMAKRTGPSRFPSVEQLRGWARMVNSIIAAMQTLDQPDAREAARYQWLRDGANGEAVSSFIQIYNYGEEAVMLDGDELDAAIDAAMAQTIG